MKEYDETTVKKIEEEIGIISYLFAVIIPKKRKNQGSVKININFSRFWGECRCRYLYDHGSRKMLQ